MVWVKLETAVYNVAARSHKFVLTACEEFKHSYTVMARGITRSKNVGWRTGRASKGMSGGGAPVGSRVPWSGRQALRSRKIFGACTSTGVGKLTPFLTDHLLPKKNSPDLRQSQEHPLEIVGWTRPRQSMAAPPGDGNKTINPRPQDHTIHNQDQLTKFKTSTKTKTGDTKVRIYGT